MKGAVILGNYSVGTRPLNFYDKNIWISKRGLTGTDLATVMIAKELADLNNEIHLFTIHAEFSSTPKVWENVRLHDIGEMLHVIDDTFDFVISFNEPNVFTHMTNKPFRICWNMLNDFHFSTPGYENQVDLFMGVCDEHTAYLRKQLPHTPNNKWKTLHLGCDPDWYEDKRIPGRVIWCSSADRGLHWLLSQWPKIKENVPEATLKIFYHFNYDAFMSIEPNDTNTHPHVVEMANRARYMLEAIKRLKDFGVDHVGSASRDEMKQALSEATAFGFTCDTVSFSEGFSVSTLEAHASYTVPVITDKDCLGGIYKNSGCLMIKGPLNEKIEEYSNTLIKVLKDKSLQDQVINKCREFAKQHTWKQVASKMEKIIIQGKESKR